MADAPLIKFAQWAPDLTSINTGATPTVQNVVPRADGYGPFPSLVAFTSALPGPCRGVFFARRDDESIAVFAGTATNLYLLTTPDNVTFSWTSVGSFAALDTNAIWQFAQYNALVIAVQGNIVPQVYQLGVSSSFGALGGSPPKAGHVAIVNQFVVLTDLTDAPSRVQWSDNGNPTIWAPGVGQSDLQDMQDGGFVRHCVGSDNYGAILQDQAIRNLVFAPGSPVVFEIVRISYLDGLLGEYSAIQAGPNIFYFSYQGFKMIPPGGTPVEIGKEQVDRFFLADLDQNNLQLFIAAIDPSSTRVYWAYKSISGVAGSQDKLIGYDWVLKQWFPVVGIGSQFLTQVSVLGLIGPIPANSRLKSLQLHFYLGGFNSANQLGTFSGPALEATLETPTSDQMSRYFISGLRPMTDAPVCFGSIGKLSTAMGTLSYTIEQPLKASVGTIPARIDTRYGRAKIRIPSGTTWTYIMGVEPSGEAQQGDR